MSENWRNKAGTLFNLQKQSTTASNGMVVANHPLGSAASAEMLAMGGNAIDAAISGLFTQSVVEPMMVGIFGGGWINIRLSDGRYVIVDDYPTAPAAVRPLSDTQGRTIGLRDLYSFYLGLCRVWNSTS